MAGFFPPGFWSTVTLLGMIIFLVFGIDLILFKAKLMSSVNKMLDKKFHVDKAIVNALEELKRKSDKEFDVDRSVTQGWGRLVLGGLLIFGAALLLINIMPMFR